MLAYRDDYVERLPADVSEAERALEEAIARARVTGDPFLLCQALYARGELLNAYHQWAEAESRHRESLVIARDNDDFHSIMMAVVGLSHVLHSTGRPLETKELYRDALRRALDAGARGYLGHLFGGFHYVAVAEGKPVRAARLWGAAMAVAVPAEDYPGKPPSGIELDEEVRKAEWERGHSMSTEEAAAYALSDS